MGVNQVTKREKKRIEVRKRWPDGKTFRRYYPNRTVAKQALNEIELAIAKGTWKELKAELSGKKPVSGEITVEQFSQIYLDDYCRHYNRRPDFKEQALVSINSILGHFKLKDLERKHMDSFVAQRAKTVVPATINRGLAVMSNLLNFAVERGHLEVNPMLGLRKLPEEQRAVQIMTLEEERSLVRSVGGCNPVVGAYVAVLGETGLRKSEDLRMEWSHIDWQKKMLSVPKTKTGEPRHVPLSDYAIGWLKFLPKYPATPWVFSLAPGKPLKEPKESFQKGRTQAELLWVRGLHDLRHYRATQWLLHGVDIQTVKYYLGHKRIETTQRYLHFVPGHAEQSVRAAQDAEAKALEGLSFQSGRQMGDSAEMAWGANVSNLPN